MHQCDHREMHPGLPLHDHVAFHDRQVNRYAEDRDSDPRHAIDKKCERHAVGQMASYNSGETLI